MIAPIILSAGFLSAGSALAVEGTGPDDVDVGAQSAKPTVEDLQRQIDELVARNEKAPVIGSSRTTMKLFGRIHLDTTVFTKSDDAINVFETGDPDRDPVNSFEFRRARLGVQGKIEDSMEYKIALDFGHPGTLTFKDLYFGFNDVPVAQTILIGNQKRPYGLDTLNSSRYNVFTERPFVVEALNQDARRPGIAAYGTDENQDWNWRYGVYNMEDWSQKGTYRSSTLQPEVAGRIASTVWWADEGRSYAHLGLSGTLAFPDGNPDQGDAVNAARFRTRPEARSTMRWLDTAAIDGVSNYQLAGLEGVWNRGPVQVTAEFMETWVGRSAETDAQFYGGYIYAAYFLTGEYMPWSRKTGTLGRPKPTNNLGPGAGAWQVAARYSFADFSDGNILGGQGESITIGLNWYWNANASLQLNYIRGTISDRSVDAGGSSFTEGDYSIIGMRMRVDF